MDDDDDGDGWRTSEQAGFRCGAWLLLVQDGCFGAFPWCFLVALSPSGLFLIASRCNQPIEFRSRRFFVNTKRTDLSSPPSPSSDPVPCSRGQLNHHYHHNYNTIQRIPLKSIQTTRLHNTQLLSAYTPFTYARPSHPNPARPPAYPFFVRYTYSHEGLRIVVHFRLPLVECFHRQLEEVLRLEHPELACHRG